RITVGYGFPPQGAVGVSQSEHTTAVATASAEAAEREAAYLRSLSPPKLLEAGPPRLKEPALQDDFQTRLDRLDEEIYMRGVCTSRERLLSLGHERFTDLLAKDHFARAIQRVIGPMTDLTDWPSVEYAFAKAGSLTTPIKQRTITEQVSGTGTDREEAA